MFKSGARGWRLVAGGLLKVQGHKSRVSGPGSLVHSQKSLVQGPESRVQVLAFILVPVQFSPDLSATVFTVGRMGRRRSVRGGSFLNIFEPCSKNNHCQDARKPF